MQDGILFDNILIADDEKVANSILPREDQEAYGLSDLQVILLLFHQLYV
jgi:hypothetical protein